MRLKRERRMFIHTNKPLIKSFYIKKVLYFAELAMSQRWSAIICATGAWEGKSIERVRVKIIIFFEEKKTVCEVEYRVQRGGSVYFTSGCKQDKACSNNESQNFHGPTFLHQDWLFISDEFFEITFFQATIFSKFPFFEVAHLLADRRSDKVL